MNGNRKYLLLHDGEHEGLFQVELQLNHHVNWVNMQTNNLMSCTDSPNQLKNYKIQDATNSMLCLEKIKKALIKMIWWVK